MRSAKSNRMTMTKPIVSAVSDDIAWLGITRSYRHRKERGDKAEDVDQRRGRRHLDIGILVAQHRLRQPAGETRFALLGEPVIGHCTPPATPATATSAMSPVSSSSQVRANQT